MKIIVNILKDYWYIWTLIIIFIVILPTVLKIFFPRIKGFFGEKSIAFYLSELDSKKYKVINNLMINSEEKISQIDHIVISNYGIFVIETKNFKGWILGDESSNYWTQIIYRHKEKFYNPIKQNYAHIQALKKALKEFPDIIFYSIVVFNSEADLKIKANTEVIYDTRLIDSIGKYQREIISDEIRDRIFTCLNALNITDKNLIKEHIKSIREQKDNIINKITNNICPKCGSLLVIRNGKYGSFKGCSNYPKCRFSINIKLD
jgi:hypothetical protein